MSDRRAGTWTLSLAMLGLAGVLVYLITQVHALSVQVDQVRASVADRQPAPRLVLAAPSPVSAAEHVDYDRLATGIATQLREAAPSGSAQPPTAGAGPSAPPSVDPEIAALAADAMGPYLHRTDLTPDAWRDFGRRVTALPEDKRDAVLRQVFGAITRQELVPPAGISFSEVF